MSGKTLSLDLLLIVFEEMSNITDLHVFPSHLLRTCFFIYIHYYIHEVWFFYNGLIMEQKIAALSAKAYLVHKRSSSDS